MACTGTAPRHGGTWRMPITATSRGVPQCCAAGCLWPTCCTWRRRAPPTFFFRRPRHFCRASFPTGAATTSTDAVPETLIARASVADGDIVFPDGMRYRLLVLPQVETMTPRLLRKVSGVGRSGSDSDRNASEGFAKSERAIRTAMRRCGRLSNELWADRPDAGETGKVGRRNPRASQRERISMGRAEPIGAGEMDLGGRAQMSPATTRERAHLRASSMWTSAATIDIAEVLITASPSYEVAVNGPCDWAAGHVVDQVRRSRRDVSADRRRERNSCDCG